MAITAVKPYSIWSVATAFSDQGQQILDASGESISCVGEVWIPGGGTKTLSAAGGGCIWFKPGSTFTLDNASSEARLGVQDLNTSTGMEDGTFDVYGAMNSGSKPSANVWARWAMTSGSKNIAHLSAIVIVLEFTTRAGADQLGIRVQGANGPFQNLGFPYGTRDVGTLGKLAQQMLMAAIRFDDGTVGYLVGGLDQMPWNNVSFANHSFASNTTPDEYGAAFRVFAPTQVSAVSFNMFGVSAVDTLEIILYEDAYSTPTVVGTPLTPDGDINSAPGGNASDTRALATPVTLLPDVDYVWALRPTSTNTMNVHALDHTNIANIREIINLNPFGEYLKFVSRTNQSGGFSEVQPYYMPQFGLWVTGHDDGAGGAGDPGTPVVELV